MRIILNTERRKKWQTGGIIIKYKQSLATHLTQILA